MDSVKDFKLTGLVPAVFTPMKKNGDINLEVIPKYAEFIKSKGISSIFVNGTTGEGPNLTINERMLVAEAWMKNSKHGLKNVVVHIGGANLRESINLAKHAADIKADAAGLMPPVFFKPSKLETLVQYCKQVAGSAPTLPFYYYNIPRLTGVNFNMLDFIKLMETEVPTFRGIKYSHWDMTEASLCANYSNRKYNMVFGVDQQILSALCFGIDAAIGSTYNYMAPIFNNILAEFKKGDIEAARREQLKTQKVLDVMFKYDTSVCIQKVVMTMCSSIDMGPCRLPVTETLSKEDYQSLELQLNQLDFFEWIK